METLGNELGPTPESPFGWVKRYRATAEAHRNRLEYRFYVEAEEINTDEWALLAGDCLFNLRSALDHLVYELHVKAFRGQVPDDVARDSAFPILSDPPGSPRQRYRSPDPVKWKEIGKLGYRQRRAIAWLQPYNRRNDYLRKVREALETVATLNNIDKHRHLHVLQATALMAAVGWFGEPPAWGFRQESFLEIPLIGKTEVFRWCFERLPPPERIAPYLDSGGHVSAFICLHESGKTPILHPLLNELVETVATVLRRFAVFLR